MSGHGRGLAVRGDGGTVAAMRSLVLGIVVIELLIGGTTDVGRGIATA